METEVVFLETTQRVSKVSSGFEYFLLIFASESVSNFELVLLDVEFNFAFNTIN